MAGGPPGQARPGPRPLVVPGRSLTDEDRPRLPGPPPVRWGVIGSTSQVARAAVLPALDASPKATLVATASRSRPDGPEPFGGRAYGSYDELLADGDVEAVYIPLPNGLHAAWTIKAAAAGKHVLCEKPLATTAAEADAMATACDATGVVLMEAYMTPFHPRSALVDDLVASGGLGALRFATASFTFTLADPGNHRWRPEMGGGALLDLGVYCLSPLMAAAGRPPRDLSASAVTTPSGVDASFSGWLDFGAGFAGAFECSFEGPERQRLEIVGTEAALSVSRAFTPGTADTEVTLVGRDGQVTRRSCSSGDPYRGMVDHFCTVLRGGAGIRRPPAESVELLALVGALGAAAGS